MYFSLNKHLNLTPFGTNLRYLILNPTVQCVWQELYHMFNMGYNKCTLENMNSSERRIWIIPV